MLEEHIQRTHNRRPEAGDYDRPEEQIPGGLDFDKMMPRPFLVEDVIDQELEGDILILDPDKLGKRLPDINFDKMRGREDLNVIKEVDEELILEPLFDLVKKK